MHISMYETLVPTANKMLARLSTFLDKADAFAAARKIEASVLLNARLAPDMFPLTRQVQIATDIAKGAAARLSGSEMPKYDDKETTIVELKARIASVLAFINGIDAAKFGGSEERDIVLQTRAGERRFKGLGYLRDFVLPNVYFHTATAYAILRHNGVELGKNDFIGAP